MKITTNLHFDKVKADVADIASKAVQEAAEMILDESNKIAPIDEGDLIRSGSVSVDGTSANIFYDTPYAVRQHEDMTLQHKNGRRAKFLESAAKENADVAAKYIQDQLKKVL